MICCIRILKFWSEANSVFLRLNREAKSLGKIVSWGEGFSVFFEVLSSFGFSGFASCSLSSSSFFGDDFGFFGSQSALYFLRS